MELPPPTTLALASDRTQLVSWSFEATTIISCPDGAWYVSIVVPCTSSPIMPVLVSLLRSLACWLGSVADSCGSG
mgnify:CR=1 FL=1